jgi:hypothetical protein
VQAAHHGAAAAALQYCGQLLTAGEQVTLSLTSVITQRDLQPESVDADTATEQDDHDAAAPPAARTRSKRARADHGPAREQRAAAHSAASHPKDKRQHRKLIERNRAKLKVLQQTFINKLSIRVPTGAPNIERLAQAQRAARHNDLHAHVATRTTHRAVTLWDDTRTWDPGD